LTILEQAAHLPAQRKAEFSFLAIGVALAAVYAYGQSNMSFLALFSNMITPFEALSTFLMAAMLFKTNSGRRGGGISRVYASYSVGFLLWFLGELTWTIYAVAFQIEIPFPSIADLFWLVGYVPLLLALLMQASPYRESLFTRKQIAITICMFGLALLILRLTIPPILQENEDLVALGVGVAYPLLDTLLLAVAVPALLFFRRGTYWRPMLFVILGIIIQLVADLAFNQTILSGSYYTGSFTDLLFDWAYLILTLGFYKQLKPNL